MSVLILISPVHRFYPDGTGRIEYYVQDLVYFTAHCMYNRDLAKVEADLGSTLYRFS